MHQTPFPNQVKVKGKGKVKVNKSIFKPGMCEYQTTLAVTVLVVDTATDAKTRSDNVWFRSTPSSTPL